jgi:heptosyltransferase-2
MEKAHQDISLSVRGGRKLPRSGMKRLLIRGTNWIGDAVMTLPAVSAVRETWPQAQISVLAKPWVAEVYRLSEDIDRIVIFEEPGRHKGFIGKMHLAKELGQTGFDCAILLQNAIEAAIITKLAGIPVRAGYNSDGRGCLLTHSVRRTAQIRRVHQVFYYLEMVKALGCRPAERDVYLQKGGDYDELAETLFSRFGMAKNKPLIGIAPGAAYGPAKRWFPERFAAVADRLINQYDAQMLIFGSAGDAPSAAEVKKSSRNSLLDISGKTDLKEAIALIAHCALFISNDSGLMHVASALGIPTVAIFGSTDPYTTSPVGKNSVVIHHDVPCSPCLKPVCPTDFRCMKLITVDEVYEAARKLMDLKNT